MKLEKWERLRKLRKKKKKKIEKLNFGEVNEFLRLGLNLKIN